jgi:hypothetical protein
MLDRFNAQHKLDLIAAVRQLRGKSSRSREGLLRRETNITQGGLWDERARA